ncbi:ATP-dependent DNA helicase RecG [Corynebacterium sp. CNCTC7651]|uniref:ATP-dependent DNA helicase RecG n=1 Tax=Corynebacterium sp. CNCTC7651 TaxID=2815361 RepID=UPI001F30DAD6|nr:ATP-dependent DNA helicase RecG [Corynebacterium sp. CNCTC7651]UIZ93040.1 ATP-dependent DNA helicase RecG [Corynebacterium sp. CNCTC7651]
MLGFDDARPLNLLIPLKQSRALAKHLDINTVGDLLKHYPRRYLHYGTGADLEGLGKGDTLNIIGTVTSTQTIHNRKQPKRPIFKVRLTDGHREFAATFFGSHYAQRVLTEGRRAMFTGKLDWFNGEPQLQHPDFVLLDGPTEATGSLRQLSHFGDLEEILAGKEWMPIYPATKVVSTWTIMGAVHTVLKDLGPIEEPLGFTPIGLLPLNSAIRQIHFPGPKGPQGAVDRLKYDEALSVALAMGVRRADLAHHTAPELPRKEGRDQDTLLRALPFPLTKGQQEVLSEISRDMEGTLPMSRLLQGEVGSGKTIVALLAMLQAVDNGAQCALLAPTEVLVMQHARSLTETLLRAGVPARVVALTGSLTAAAKQEALLKIMTGEADIVVGTHALIQEGVEFFRLGFVVVDEQHRFGVEQRDQLRAKAGETTPHLLVMTATPIPRTIAITVFGDLAVSTLTELPGGRKPIQSFVVPEFRAKWVERAWAKIREEVGAGHQVYIVCPRIDGAGGVTETAALLQSTVLAGLEIAVLHGRMKGEEKDAVMTAFAAGAIDVLVSTTVIEVGVDVPNATVMMVREAEHFGVSQLHQLRGRVGRGGNQSICFFHTAAEPETPSFQRVESVANTSDGFALAELDLMNRREGDVLGTEQSGIARTLRLVNLVDDYPTVKRAYDDAAGIIANNLAFARAATASFRPEDFEYLDKS